VLTFDMSEGVSGAPVSAASRFSGIEKRMKERADKKAQGATAASKFFAEFSALERGVKAQLHVDDDGGGGASSSDQRAVRQEQADDALQSIQRMRDLLTAQGAVLTSFDAAKAAATVQECEAALALFKATHLPKKAFGFRAAIVPPPAPAAPEAAPAPPVVEAASSRTTLIEERSNCAIVLRQADVSNDVTLKGLTGCRVWIDAQLAALRCDALVDCRVMCGNVAGSMWIKRSTNCVFVGTAHQVRVADSHASLFQIRTRSRIGVEASDTLRFAALCPVDGCLSARFDDAAADDPERDAWRLVQDFDWIKPSTPSPNWAIVEPAPVQRLALTEFD